MDTAKKFKYRGGEFTASQIINDITARIIVCIIVWVFIPPLCGITWIAIFFIYFLITGEPLWE